VFEAEVTPPSLRQVSATQLAIPTRHGGSPGRPNGPDRVYFLPWRRVAL